MIQEKIHQRIVENCEAVGHWFDEKSKGLCFSIYSSFDVRDSGWKVAPVDANIFPAGFNNICHADKEKAPILMKSYLTTHYPHIGGRIAVLTEEHTNNAYYWENIWTLKDVLTKAGFEVFISLPRNLAGPIHVQSVSGHDLTVYEAVNKSGETFVNGEKIDLIICNNDFSENYTIWSSGLRTPMNPPRELGWYRRRKHHFFKQYNQLAGEFASLIKLDANLLQIETELYEKFDANDPDKIEDLATKVDVFLAKLKEKYKSQNLNVEPFCFIKNNSGTYGLAVIQAHSGAEIRDWSGKARKKMKAAKGGRDVEELIIQEGIPTRFQDDDGGSAEPCIYMIGDQLVGGFLRAHSKKGPEENLNSPGAVYKRLCMSDLHMDMPGCPMENVYGWISKLSALAIAWEAREANIEFRGYKI